MAFEEASRLLNPSWRDCSMAWPLARASLAQYEQLGLVRGLRGLRRHNGSLFTTHSRPTQPTQRQHDTCTQNVVDDHTDHAHATKACHSMTEHASISCRHATSTSAASRAQRPITAPGLHIGTPAPLHNIEYTCDKGLQEADHARTDAAILAVDPPPTRPLVRCHIATLPHAKCVGLPIAPKPANDATSGGRTRHSIRSWRTGIIAGSCDEAVASRADQSRSTKEESGRDHVCRWLDTCRRTPWRCAPFVLSGCLQEVENLDLEPDPVQKTEMMRSCSRRSHHLRGKSARTIADKRINSGTAAWARGGL